MTPAEFLRPLVAYTNAGRRFGAARIRAVALVETHSSRPVLRVVGERINQYRGTRIPLISTQDLNFAQFRRMSGC